MNKPNTPSSIYFLLITNCVPIFGVLYFGWNLLDVIFLYWAETVIIGFFSLLKLLLLRDEEKGWVIILMKFMRILACIFFILHFGGFVAGIGIMLYFIVLYFLKVQIQPLEYLFAMKYALLFFFLSHGYSFVFNFLIKGERKSEKTRDPMFEPYRRVIIMHLTLAFSMGAVIYLGQPFYLLITLISLKTITDLWSHLKERKDFRQLKL